jgi:hypothetical protein
MRETIAPSNPSFTFCMLMPGLEDVACAKVLQISGDGGVDGTRNPRSGFGDEAVEEGAGGGADVVAALRMPLHAENEMGGGPFAGLAAFHGFDDGVLRAASGDAEPVAGNADGLVVA